MAVAESVDSREFIRRIVASAALVAAVVAAPGLHPRGVDVAGAEEQPAASQPIRMSWVEGDSANFNPIYIPDNWKPVGIIEFRQHLHGDTLELRRVARFHDGTSDEDVAEARVGERLVPLRGRTILRNEQGVATADLSIDVVGGRVWGFAGV